jgi:fatty-acyl-CoA synthase
MLVNAARSKFATLATLAQSGVIRPTRPDRVVASARALLRWGPTPAAGFTISAVRYPDETAVIDELGTLTFRQIHDRTNKLANALSQDQIREGDSVGIMCRNHRGFVEAVTACSKLGANSLFLNTAFSGPQLADVVERENPKHSSSTRSSRTCSPAPAKAAPAISPGASREARRRTPGWTT